MDRHVEHVAALLGIAPMTVDYEWIARSESDVCGSEYACYSSHEGRVFSPEIPHAHEVTHAVLLGGGYQPDHFLNEGLAVLLSDNIPVSDYALKAKIEDVLAFVSMPTVNIPAGHYGRSAHFVAFLLETYGESAIRALASKQWAGRSEVEQSAVMISATGDTLSEVLEQYAAVPDCSVLDFRKALVECAEEPVPWSEMPVRAWSTAIPLACERDDVRGPWGTRMWTSRTFEVAAEGEFELTAYSAGETGQVVVRRCDSRCGDSFRVVLEPGAAERRTLKPGRHVVTLLREVEHPGEIGLAILPLEE